MSSTMSPRSLDYTRDSCRIADAQTTQADRSALHLQVGQILFKTDHVVLLLSKNTQGNATQHDRNRGLG